MRKNLVILLIAVVAFSSCDKDEDTAVPQHTYTIKVHIPLPPCGIPRTANWLEGVIMDLGLDTLLGDNDLFQAQYLGFTSTINVENNSAFSVAWYQDQAYEQGRQDLIHTQHLDETMRIDVIILEDGIFYASHQITLTADYHPSEALMTSVAGGDTTVVDSTFTFEQIMTLGGIDTTYTTFDRTFTFNLSFPVDSISYTDSTMIITIETVLINGGPPSGSTVTTTDTTYSAPYTLWFNTTPGDTTVSISVVDTTWHYTREVDLVNDTTWNFNSTTIYFPDPDALTGCDSLLYVW